MFESISPARLKVLLGAMQVTSFLYPGMTLPRGVWTWPRRSRSQCISSEMTHISCFSSMPASLWSSWGVQTRPLGLCGSQWMKSLVFSSAQRRSRSSQSML